MSLSVKRSPSVESTGSIVLSKSDSRTAGRTSSDSEYELYDCSAVLIECPVHEKFALERISGKKGYWLPKSVVTPQTGFKIALTSRLKQVLPRIRTGKGYIDFSAPEMFHYLRLQVPEVGKFVTRCVYKTTLLPEEGTCCTTTKDLVWVTSADLESANMWGPEPGIFIRSLNADQVLEPLQELTTTRALKSSTVDAKFLAHSKYAEKDIQRLYCEFIQHCWPAQLMTKESLASYLMAVGWIQNLHQSEGFFRAFSICGKNYLNFREFFRGIVASDRDTEHSQLGGMIRSEYIFRLYDVDGDMVLSPSEFRSLVKDSMGHGTKDDDGKKDEDGTKDDDRKKNEDGKKDEDGLIEKQVHNVASSLGVPADTRWDEKLVKEAIGGLHIRGTSKLFRGSGTLCSSRSGVTFVYRDIDSTFEDVTSLTLGRKRSKESKCPECKKKHYMVAAHSVRLTQDGLITDPTPIIIRDNEKMAPELRSHSNDVFSKKSVSNLALNWIRSKQFSSIPGPQLVDIVLKLCGQAERRMRTEERMVSITAPVLVTGCLLGNSQALLGFEQIFWPKGPCIEAPTFLFLGNNINSGINGLETIIHLLALKVQCPNRVVILKGREERKEQVDQLVKELSGRTSDVGRIGSALQEVFDSMPLTAVIDHSIFCTSSGVPSSITSSEELIHAQSENVSNEILNGDPQRQEAKYGGFMSKSGFTHIVTGSEFSDTGIRYRLNGRALSIFSCPNYENKNNSPGLLMIDDSKIRPIRVTF